MRDASLERSIRLTPDLRRGRRQHRRPETFEPPMPPRRA